MAKKSTLPKPLTQAFYTEAVLKDNPPSYPDSGVGFAGYAKVKTSTGWQLLKQDPVRLGGFVMSQGDPAISRTLQAGKVFYLTKWAMYVLPGEEATCFLFSYPNGTARLKVDQTFTAQNGVAEMNFNPPIKFENTLQLSASISAGGYIEATFYGYYEDRSS